MKTVARLLVLLPLLWVEGAWAVDCPDTNYYLSTQAEVDALGATDCDRVSGRLIIRASSGITNLDSLTNITSIGNYLAIDNNSALTNLDGLINLSSVGYYLTIDNNSALTNLDGLINLNSVGHNLTIKSNSVLTNLDGLANLASVGLHFSIAENVALANLGGLINLTSVGGVLAIWANDALTNLDGLNNLNGVVSALYLGSNSALTNLVGLANLTSVGGYLYIHDNAALNNLDGLTGLTSVGGYLYIHDNAALNNLDGLTGLTSVGSYLSIGGNAALTNLYGLINVTSVGGDLKITRNAALTNLDGLINLTGVGGHLFIDFNYLSNCQGIAPLLGWPSGPPEDGVVGIVSLYSNGIGCNSVAEVLDSVSGPTQPVIDQASPSSASISLGFSPSTTTDTLFPITGYSASCTGSDVDVSDPPSTNLLDNTPITETLTVAGYDPTSVLSSIEVDLDITHGDPTDLYITLTTPEGTELVLWNQGSSGGEDLIGTFPTTLTSVDGLDSVTRQTMDGDWVLSIEDIDVGPLVREGVLNSWGIRITEELARNGSGSPIEVFGATRGRDYTCTVAPVTKLGTTPVSDPYTVTVPLELPSVPTITSTDYEDGKIILTVSVSDNGGADITGYEATCTDGTNTYTDTRASSPITISGLTNGVAYTCTVTATNSVGTSSASAATAPITPEEMVTGLPIWLLYQATQ